MIWDQLIGNSNVQEKAMAVIANQLSPVGAVYDYIMNDFHPNNPNLAAPPGAHIYLGCGDKVDVSGQKDTSRFDNIIKKAREDLKIIIVPCPLGDENKHSQEYIDIMNANPSLKEGLPSVKKGLNFEDFHASDMRYLIPETEKSWQGLRLFSDFLPPEDSLAVLGILGINPTNEEHPEERPSILEIINDYISEVVVESFQEKVAKPRLARAMKVLLDGGRHDLTKYGGAFHLPRPKYSNAFVAEVSTMSNGNVAIAAVKKKTRRKKKKK